MSLLLAPLHALLCAVENVAYLLLHLVVVGVNALIAGLAFIISNAIDLLPTMGSIGVPSVPSTVSTAAAWVAWVIPVGTIISILSWFLAVWVVWQVVAIALRWAKATSE